MNIDNKYSPAIWPATNRNIFCNHFGMDQNYLLNSVHGVDVILIPGSGHSVCVFDPGTQATPGRPEPFRATILAKELAFQPTGNAIIAEDELLKVIRWYSYLKTFPEIALGKYLAGKHSATHFKGFRSVYKLSRTGEDFTCYNITTSGNTYRSPF